MTRKNLMRDLAIVRHVAAKRSFRDIGRELKLSGSRVHQLYKRTLNDIYVTAGRGSAPERLRATLQQHPVMVERVLESYAETHGNG